jgi:ubiquinone/menaquinone biosynthesis C-methylase UbiE
VTQQDAGSGRTHADGEGQAIPTGLTASEFASAPAAAHFARRTALKDAAFFLPYLQPGIRLLDCGCGPGTISIGLSELIAPGELVGIDTSDRLLEAAREHAREQGLTNTRFELADIHNLPFDAGSFDAAIVSRVLEHLADPVAAMREVRRVLKPGGVVGVCSSDYGGAIIAPIDPLLEQWVALHRRHRESYGGNPLMGRFLRATLLEAGFVRVVGSASSEYYGDAEGTRSIAGTAIGLSQGAGWGDTVVAKRFTDRETLDQLVAAWRAWGERPDALYVIPHGEAVGWAP